MIMCCYDSDVVYGNTGSCLVSENTERYIVMKLLVLYVVFCLLSVLHMSVSRPNISHSDMNVKT